MPVLLPWSTILDNVLFPLKMLGSDVSDGIAKAHYLLDMVGLGGFQEKYPRELSGGMRQRVMIAMGLSCDPKLLIADEPTTALDVTIQAQILEIMGKLASELGTAVLIITHNLGVVARYADRVNVMYAGRIVETGTAEDVFNNPQHGYTVGLMASVPRLDDLEHTRLATIEGQPPLLINEIHCCAFRHRCS